MSDGKTNPTNWLLGGILAILLAIFGYIITLTRDTSCTKTEVQALKTQMQQVAEYIGPLWMAHVRKDTTE